MFSPYLLYNKYYTIMIKEKDVVWPIRMPKSLKDKLKNYCDSKGYSMNKLIKILIEKEITNE